jgi:hypothetical protein
LIEGVALIAGTALLAFSPLPTFCSAQSTTFRKMNGANRKIAATGL